MTKISRKVGDKEYEYDYSMVYLQKETHHKLKEVSHNNKKTFSEMINVMIQQYEGNI